MINYQVKNKSTLNEDLPLVSVCLAVFNNEKTIKRAIDSILNQKTDFEFELVINDDASVDKTPQIIKEYKYSYPDKIKCILQSHNQFSIGICPFNDILFENTKGTFIAMCEGDDYWIDRYKLQKQVDLLKKNEDYGLVHTEFSTYYSEPKYMLKKTHDASHVLLQHKCSNAYWNFSGSGLQTIKTVTVCFRFALLEDWLKIRKVWNLKANKPYIVDFALFFYLSCVSKIGYIDTPTAVYVTSKSGSLSNSGLNIKKSLDFQLNLLKIKINLFNDLGLDWNLHQNAIKRDIFQCILLARQLNSQNQIKEILDIVRELKQNYSISKNMGINENFLNEIINKPINYLRLQNLINKIKTLLCRPKLLHSYLRRKLYEKIRN